MQELDQTLSALSDPTRRQIVNMLSEKSLSAGEIGKTFEISAPALSRHLRILRRSGLVDDERDPGDNRLRIFRLRLSPLSELRDWLKQVDDFWNTQLLAFKQYAEKTTGDKNNGNKND